MIKNLSWTVALALTTGCGLEQRLVDAATERMEDQIPAGEQEDIGPDGQPDGSDAPPIPQDNDTEDTGDTPDDLEPPTDDEEGPDDTEPSVADFAGTYNGDLEMDMVVFSTGLGGGAPAFDSCTGALDLVVDATGEGFASGTCVQETFANVWATTLVGDVDAEGAFIGELELLYNGQTLVLDVDGVIAGGVLEVDFDATWDYLSTIAIDLDGLLVATR